MRAMIVWNSNPLVIVPNAERSRRGLARDDLFTVVHEQFMTDTALYADIVLPATTHIEADDVTPAWGHLWMGWNEAAIEPLGESVEQLGLLPTYRRRDGPHRTVAVRRRHDDPARRAADRRSRRAPPRPVDEGALPRRRHAVGRRWLPHRVRQGGVRRPTCSKRWVSHACRPSCPREGPRATPHARPFPAAVDDAETPHPVPELGVLAPAQARPGRGWPVRRAGRRRRAGRGLVAGGDGPVSQRPGQPRAPGQDQRHGSVPAWRRSRGGGGATIIPTARSPTSLTNDTLTEWGGGVAYSDTLVQVEAVGPTPADRRRRRPGTRRTSTATDRLTTTWANHPVRRSTQR